MARLKRENTLREKKVVFLLVPLGKKGGFLIIDASPQLSRTHPCYFNFVRYGCSITETIDQRIAFMNRINPNKLLLSKWTAVEPNEKERHFIVTKMIRAENEEIIACELEAVITKKSYEMDWRELKDTKVWKMGWE